MDCEFFNRNDDVGLAEPPAFSKFGCFRKVLCITLRRSCAYPFTDSRNFRVLRRASFEKCP